MALTSRALAFVSRWFDEGTVHRTFEPLIADWQREWQDASPARRPGISVRACLAFVCAVVISTPKIALTPVPVAVTNQIAVRMVRFIAVVTAVLMIPPVMEIGGAISRGSTWATYSLILFAVPSALTLAFPFAMTGAVDVLRRRELMPAHVERAVLLKLGAVAIAFMFVFSGWVVPAASTAGRRSINPPGMQEPLRTIGDLNTYELLVDPDRANVFAPRTQFPFSSRSATLQRELSQRTAILALPVVLLWLRWRALSRHRKPLPAVLATVAAIVTLFAVGRFGATIEREWQLWAGISAWLPIATFALWGAVAHLLATTPSLGRTSAEG